MDLAVGAAAKGTWLSQQAQDALIDAALRGDVSVLLLAKHYASQDRDNFIRHALRYLKVYDFTDSLEEHPSGVDATVDYGGRDGTETFESVHSLEMLDGFTPIGELADNSR